MNRISQLIFTHLAGQEEVESRRIFAKIAKKIAEAGYKLPFTITKISNYEPLMDINEAYRILGTNREEVLSLMGEFSLDMDNELKAKVQAALERGGEMNSVYDAYKSIYNKVLEWKLREQELGVEK